MTGFAARLDEVRAEIAAACASVGRDVDSVTLVAASKSQSVAAIREAWAAGHRHFGENYASELKEKRAALADLDDVVWHFIGRVQASNAKVIAGAALVHGVGSLSQLEALAKASSSSSTPLPVLLQVNLVDEATKNGFSAAGLRNILPALSSLPTVQVRGLMAMPFVDDDTLPAAFAAVTALRDEIATTHGLSWPVLSMGMSADFAAAIVAGATHVRVGTRLFGSRAPLPEATP